MFVVVLTSLFLEYVFSEFSFRFKIIDLFVYQAGGSIHVDNVWGVLRGASVQHGVGGLGSHLAFALQTTYKGGAGRPSHIQVSLY